MGKKVNFLVCDEEILKARDKSKKKDRKPDAKRVAWLAPCPSRIGPTNSMKNLDIIAWWSHKISSYLDSQL